jgi:hypothetical protein
VSSCAPLRLSTLLVLSLGMGHPLFLFVLPSRISGPKSNSPIRLLAKTGSIRDGQSTTIG